MNNKKKNPLVILVRVLPFAVSAAFMAMANESVASGTSIATGSFPRSAEVQTLPDTKVAQTLSHDNGVLSVLFNDIKASAQNERTATAGATILIRVPIAPLQKTRVFADLRGSKLVSGKAQCRVALSSIDSTVIARGKDGSLFARIKLIVKPGMSELVLLASVLCERRSEGAALATLDSIDLAWDKKRG